MFTGAAGTQPYITTLGLDLSAAGGDFVAAANQAKFVYSQVMASETSNALVLDRVTLTVGSDGPGGSVDSDTPPTPMTRSGTFGPTAMSAIARKVTNELGRRGRGRMFLPAVATENEIDPDGSLISARRTSLSTALQTLYNGLTDDPAAPLLLPPVLLHSQAPADPTPITAFAVSDLVGWIRGRIR